MPTPPNLPALLFAGRMCIHVGSQGALGELLGSSRRTGQRWETGASRPSPGQLQDLARRVHPHDASLAAQIAAAGDSSLVALGLEKPPAPPQPPAPPPVVPLAQHVIDSVVCAAADAIDVLPRTIRPALLAALTRARHIGLTLEDMERALSPEPTPQKVTRRSASPAR
jgi:hypothetical protein